MAEKQKLESSNAQRPFGALLGSTKRLPLNENGMLAQYDTFNEVNEAEAEATKARRILEEQRSQRKKWVSVSRIYDSVHGKLMALLAPAVYLVLYTAYDSITTKSATAGGEYPSFSPGTAACAALCIEVGKAFVSLVAYLAFSSESWPGTGKLASYMVALAFPAACYSGITVINISKLGNISLMKFGIWHQASIFLSILLWFGVFRRRCGVQQSIAHLVLFAGCSVNAMQPGMMFAVEETGLWVLACCALSAIGCVSNEHFYKSNKAADINLQNVVLYLMTTSCSVLFIMRTCRERLMSSQSFFHGFQNDCWILIVLQVFSGLAVSQMLKHTGVITKCYATALGISFEVFLAQRFSSAGDSMHVGFAAFLIAMSALLYLTADVPRPPSLQQNKQGEISNGRKPYMYEV